MAVMNFLNEVKEFLKENVAKTIKLQVPPEDNEPTTYKLANPEVHTGWIPPDGMLENLNKFPSLVVGYEEGKRNLRENSKKIDLIISCAVYSPGENIITEEAMKFTPNMNGYIDLINLIDRVEGSLSPEMTIGDMSIEDEVVSGVYKESAYPYFYGYVKLSFSKKNRSKTEMKL